MVNKGQNDTTLPSSCWWPVVSLRPIIYVDAEGRSIAYRPLSNEATL